MAAPDGRRALTIRLAREGRTLLRTLDRAEPPRPTAPAPDRFPLLPAVDTIARTLDQGTAADVARLLSGPDAADAGRALFQTLFGAESDLTALVRDLTGDPTADARKHPLRVRVVTADPLFAGLPYRLATLAGDRLEALGYTFEITHEAALRPPPPRTWNHVFVGAEGAASPERLPSPGLWRPAPTALRDVRFPPRDAPPRVLVVAPVLTPQQVAASGAPPPALDLAAHVRALRDGLAALGLPHDDPAFLRVVRTAEDLGRALAGMLPDVVHILAYLDGDALVLEARDGGPARLPLAELGRWLAAAPPLVITLAGCPLAGCPFPAAFAAVAPLVPLFIVHRTGAWTDAVATAMLSALLTILGADGDPIAALRAAGEPATATVQAAYARWICDGPPPRPTPFALASRRALDPPRAAALARVTTLARSADARVLALILPAQDTRGARPLLDELDVEGRHLGRLRVLTLPPDEGEDPLAAWKSALCIGIDAGATIEEALRWLSLDAGWAPIGGTAPEPASAAYPQDRASFADRPGERGLVWLDGGVRGPAPLRPLTTASLAAWLEVGAEVLAPRCPAELRVVWSITVDLDADERERLTPWLAARPAAAGFAVALLPPARALSRDEIRSCLEEPWPEPCPAALLDSVTDAILAHAHGELGATLALVRHAHTTSWAALLRALDQTEAPAGEEIL